MDAKRAWYSVGVSSTQLDTTSSSYSLLHSIYGSQTSQLPFSDYDSEASLIATQSEHHVQSRSSSPTLKKRLSRPKSSPASVIAAREQLRSQPTPTAGRPGSALIRQPRPGSAARRIARGRPASAAVGRPASAASPVRGGASPIRRRPKTAMGFQRSPSLSGSSTLLLDLEEEEEGEDTGAPIIRETAPVRLTHTPEYFDFWQGKPLRERDFGVKVHKRKAWKRPKSDYGTRFLNRNRTNKDDGQDDKGDGLGGLETLLEKDSDSTLGSRRGSRDFGALGDKGNVDDSSKLSVSGEGMGGSRRGSKDFGGTGNKGTVNVIDESSLHSLLRSRSTSSSGNRNKGDGKGSKGRDGLGSRHDQSEWGDKDGAAADDDDYFKNSTDDSNSKGTVLPTLSNKSNINLTALDDNTDLHDNWQDLSHKENVEQVKSVRSHTQRERRPMKQLQPTEHLPPLGVTDDDGYDCDPGRALAAASWMDGGTGSGSGNSTRFELPMDMRTLEKMTPLDYLNTHCVISKRRMAHCSKIFKKLDTKRTFELSVEGVKLGLVQSHHNCITEEQATSVLDLVGLSDDMTIKVKLFAAICCFAERMLNLFFLPLARKDVIEAVDFEALDWKLRDCTIKNSLQMLFSQL